MKKDNEELPEEESEIDLIEIAQRLWAQRKKILKWCAVGAVIGLIVGFSIPKEYTTSVKLAPEANGSKSMSSSLSALASMAGFGSGADAGTDAVSPILYPDVVSSVPFLTGLFDVEVPLNKKDSTRVTVQTYLEDYTRVPWWSYIFKLPGAVIGLFTSDDDDAPGKVDSFRLTPEQTLLVKSLSERISTTYDNKTSLITVTVRMQDPLVSAVLADTVVSRLQTFITDYRTSKARKDLAYAQLLNDEAKQNYYAAQQKYAEYLDRNIGVALHSVQTSRDRLENEAALAFNLYNQTAQQVQLAQAKVQETTPVYTVVTPATVPIKATSPRKAIILIAFVFLAAVACSFKILFGPVVAEKFAKSANQIKSDHDDDQ